MNILVLGAGMMGRAIAYDLAKFSKFQTITIADKDKKTIKNAEEFLKNKKIIFKNVDLNKSKEITKYFINNDIVISAVPYFFNYILTKTAIETKTHFLDLGGNNKIVEKQRNLFNSAKKNGVTVVPDCGLAPGLVSVITKDIFETLDKIEYVKIRVGGLPLKPRPPFNYQIVFSLNGLINEYIEDAIVLDNGNIITKKSMDEVEDIYFPKPFGKLEAFLTSGGCSTLPYTYKDKINYLDYKTIRYPGHCEKFKLLLDLGLGDEKPIKIVEQVVFPRKILISLLEKIIPSTGQDVVLCKVSGRGKKDNKRIDLEYLLIDHYDKINNITSMMRTTGYPVSIIAQMINNSIINESGVFTNEEIVPCKIFFKELEKRNIIIKKREL
jgi:lysine 6-dehydrogenase